MPALPTQELLDAVRARRPALLRHVGNTPLVPLQRLSPNPKVQILAKLESFNPGGSIKDRTALSMIEYGEASGELRPGMSVLEATSGNTGIGLAMVCAVKGYHCVLAMAESVSLERRKILAALGAELMLTPGELGTDGAIELAYELGAKEPERFYLTDQYNNPGNPLAHYYGTAEEVWAQTEGKLSHFVASMGTTGTIIGVARRLRELNPDIKLIGVEPHLGHRIQGLKNLKESYTPGIYDRSLLSLKPNVDDDAAFEMARRLAKEEGLLVGMSSGAAVAVACDLARSLSSGMIVVVLPDGGERYLSTTLFQMAAAPPEPSEPKLHFLNTLTRKDERFVPQQADKVSLYTCGPTVHALPHLGLYRRIVVADLVRRTVELAGWPVEHVMNITDIDDRTIQAAETQELPLQELCAKVQGEFMEDLHTLRVKPAEHFPKASEYTDAMAELTAQLVEGGFAYEKHKSVYFDIGKFGGYGRLSGIDVHKIHLGATVDLDSYAKDDPRDFTLLKRSTLGEIKKGLSHRTKWGNVRPGWHIECATMAMKLLGCADIHVGGVDLIFPHHENEIAICEAACGHAPAKYWIHSGLVMVDGRKMSRSAGTAVTVRELLERGYEGRHLRFFLLGQYYRQPLHFSFAALDATVVAVTRLDECVRKLRHLLFQQLPQQTLPQPSQPCDGLSEQERLVSNMASDFEARFREALFDDLNVAAASAAVFNFVRWLNKRLDGELSAEAAQLALRALELADSVFAVFPAEDDAVDDELLSLVERREQARNRKDWAAADALREELEARSVLIEDTPQGPRWRRKS
ncbi:MAG: cysteine--tRNA ligase [Myxococcota bacterium]|nr:cysteine--tRNA ligase [Myxococcota bacterium]